jgi:hypothetical protein
MLLIIALVLALAAYIQQVSSVPLTQDDGLFYI